MPDAPDDEIAPTAPPNPVPFLVALVGFVIVAVLAYVYLRDDDPGRLVRPDEIEVVGDDTVRLRYGGATTELAWITDVGYALGDDVVFVELVVREEECLPDGDCGGRPDFLEVDLVLPEPIGDREVEPGTGRVLAECGQPNGAIPVCR